MAGQGWVAIHRQLQNNWLWSDKPFAYGQAWVDMIMMANHEEKTILFEGEVLTIQRGMFHTSILKLSEKYGWNRKKTTKFINLLENQKMVTTKRTTHGTTISIENYDVYQELGTTNGAIKRDNRDTNEGKPLPTNNNENNYNNEKGNIYTAKNQSSDEIEEFFERLWKMYPNKKGKGDISKTSKQKLFKLGEDKAVRGIERYKAYLEQNKSWLKPQGGGRFFNKTIYEYASDDFEEGENVHEQVSGQRKEYKDFGF